MVQAVYIKLLELSQLPTFEKLEDTLLARFLNLVCLFGIIGSVGSMIVLPTFEDRRNFTSYLVAIGTILVATCIVLTLIRLKRLRIASLIILAAVWLVFGLNSILLGSGLTDISYLTLLATTPILAGFLFGSWASFFVLILNILIGFYLALLERNGSLPIGTIYSPIARLVAYFIIFMYVPLLADLWKRYQSQLFTAETEIIATRLENDLLEETVEARTKQLEKALSASKILSTQLSEQLEKEHELNAMKSTIITNISHAFRTPMAIINNTAELIERQNLRADPSARPVHPQRIKEQIFTIDAQLEDILVVSQLQTEIATPPLTEKIKLSHLADQLQHSILAEYKDNHRFDLRFDPNDHQIYKLPSHILLRITSRLVSNAVKFSPKESPIQIDFLVKNQRFCLNVMDSGIGVPEGAEKKIFDAFFRGNNGINRSGLGLGLFIASQLVNQIEGELTFQRQPDREGVIFTVLYPLQ